MSTRDDDDKINLDSLIDVAIVFSPLVDLLPGIFLDL